LTSIAARADRAATANANEDDLPNFDVRSAEWLESIDGSAGDDSGNGSVGQVVQLSGEAASAPVEDTRPTDPGAEAVAPGKFNVPGGDPLSRLTWSAPSSQFDPGQTLKDWAEGAGLMVAFGVVALWLVRQWLSRRDLPGRPTAHLRTIESLSLPQRCRLHLVEVDGRQVLVAVDAAGVKSVTVLLDRFATLLDGADGRSEPGIQHAELPEAGQQSTWNEMHESRLT
jgi:flagellar biogenesis protein FliO